MKLNPDLIRDILLTVEETSTFNHATEYQKDKHSFPRLNTYSHDEIIYHIEQCSLSNLIRGVHYYDGGEDILITDLTPSGHEFIANIRENNNWNKVKNCAENIGSFSISTLQQIAINVISNAISNIDSF